MIHRITIQQARIQIGNCLDKVSRDLEDWEHVRQTVMNDPIRQAINPVSSELSREFNAYGLKAKAILIHYQIVQKAIQDCSEN